MKLSGKIFIRIILLLILFSLSACFKDGTGDVDDPTNEDVIPTPTEGPLAARVNGEGILLSEYEAEYARYKAGVEKVGEAIDLDIARQEILDDLIEQVLFAQAAAKEEYFVTEADLQKEIDKFVETLGNEAALNAYLSDNYYDLDSFRVAVARDIAVIWKRNQILGQVPQTADQVRARQILVDSENEAIGIHRQLEIGTSFKELAFQYEPLTGGELGWFPRGYLLQPDVENAAFSLQVGQYSDIIATEIGFHIVEVIERDAQHPLSQDVSLFIQRQTLEQWLADQTSVSTIEILVP